MIYHMSKEVARNRADTMPALPAVVNAAVAAKYFLSRIKKFFKKSVKICLFTTRKMASSSPKKKNDGSPGLSKQASDLRIK